MPEFGTWEKRPPNDQPGARKHFGRLKRFDERSAGHQIRANRLTLWRSAMTYVRWKVRHRPWWKGNQNWTSQCTAFSALHAWEAGKSHARSRGRILYGVPRPPIGPKRIYDHAQLLDPWEGSETTYPYYEGSSCTAAAQTLKEFGLITSYDWEFQDVEVMERAIFIGPLVIGIDWHIDMMLPQRADRFEDAIIHPTGPLVGGHAIAVTGFDKRREGAEWELLNSWEPDWGFNGRCYLSKDDMATLLEAEGECCMFNDSDDAAVLEALKNIG